MEVAEVPAFGERGPAVSVTELLVKASTELLTATWDVPIDVERQRLIGRRVLPMTHCWLPELQNSSRSTGNRVTPCPSL